MMLPRIACFQALILFDIQKHPGGAPVLGDENRVLGGLLDIGAPARVWNSVDVTEILLMDAGLSLTFVYIS